MFKSEHTELVKKIKGAGNSVYVNIKQDFCKPCSFTSQLYY